VTRAPDGVLERAIDLIHRVEDIVIALLLTAIVLLAPLQIALRTFFDAGIGWLDPLLRASVLWLGLLGALAASRGDRHINIDALSRLVSERGKRVVHVFTSLFTAGICGVVAWHASRLILIEIEYESVAFSGIPAWWLEVVIPVSFGLIALRYLLLALRDARGVSDDEEPTA
jgi:TRAP-type C4-dicarboxylate transport system permease small subunit